MGGVLERAQAMTVIRMLRCDGCPVVPWRYALATLSLNLAWELLQLPLYTLWWSAPPREILFALLHCTAGDLIIAITTLLLAHGLVAPAPVIGRADAAARFRVVALAAVGFGVAYTGFSEWLNVYVRQSWAYSAWMPVLPGLGIGLAPVLQWLAVPAASFAWSRRTRGPRTGIAFGENDTEGASHAGS